MTVSRKSAFRTIPSSLTSYPRRWSRDDEHKRLSLIDLFTSRIGVILVTWLYAVSLSIAHSSFLSERWGYWGFSYHSPNVLELLFMMTLVSVAGAFIPDRLEKPSALALWLIYTVVVVPTCVITINLHDDAAAEYGVSLACLIAGFCLACILTLSNKRSAVSNVQDSRRIIALPPNSFDHILLGLWAVAAIAILLRYGRIMSFASIDEIYSQRLIFTESTSGAISYVMSYFASVFCPVLVALGLFRKKYWLSLIGVIGFVIVYAAVASKTAVALPIFITFMFLIFKARSDLFRSTSFLTGAIFALVVIALITHKIGLPGAQAFLDMLVFRTLGIPGLSFSQYSEYFGSFGHTYWSNIRGLDLLIPPPAAYGSDPTWPDLGGLIGSYYYGNFRIQANAHLFSGEGVAAAGAFGVIVIGIVFGGWLRLIDWLSRPWDYRFVAVALFPLFNALTNGSLSTAQTSFGGGLWILIFILYQPRKLSVTGLRL